MNEKFTIAGLADALAKRHGMEAEDADVFVRSFFSLIEEALVSDRYVKIRGLGTFKLIDVDSRESISVNTGERIEIQGHLRITFTPDQAMRNTVNKPFSHFETVLLHEGVNFDDIVEVEDEEGESSSDETEKDVVCHENANEPDESLKPAVVESSGSEQAGVEAEVETETEETPEPSRVGVQEECDTEESQDSGSDIRRSMTMRTVAMILLALLLGVLIGGSVIWWAFVKGRETGHDDMKESMAASVDSASDTLVKVRPDTIVPRSLIPEAKDSLPDATECLEVEPLSDATDYEMAGTLSSHVVQSGESLVKIALKYYGSKRLWPYIERYNKDLLENADNLPVGTTIRIPKLVPKEMKTDK